MAKDRAADIISFKGGPGASADAAAPAQRSAPQRAAPSAGGERHAGDFLAAAREAAGLSVAEVSEATKIKPHHIDAIEAMRADRLPPLPYASGFVKSYARFLGLDSESVAEEFRSDLETSGAIIETLKPAAPVEASGDEGAKLVSVFAILAIVLFVLWVGVQVLSGGGAPQTAPEGPRVIVGSTPLAPPSPRAPDPAADLPPADEAAPEIAGASERLFPRRAQPDEAAPAEPQIVETGAPATPGLKPAFSSAELIRSAAPHYPEACAGGARDEESVTLSFDISPAGRAANVKVVSSSNSCFEGEALRAMQRWRFSPRMIGGEKVAETGKSATLNFKK